MSTAALPRWRIWFLATRPWSLTISITPIILASMLAWQDDEFSPLAVFLMLMTSVMTHIGCNLTNDYFDHHSGVDAIQMEGQGRMLQEGHLGATDLRTGMIASFGLALLFGAPIIARLGWVGVVFALVGAGVAFLYTGGPWPLAYNRMGEVGVFLAMGIVMVAGAYYVHTGTVTLASMVLATSVGLYAAAILHANNMRDIHVDKGHHKHTLANTFGWAWGIREYGFLILTPVAITLGLIALRPDYFPLLTVVAMLPSTIHALHVMHTTPEGRLSSAIVRSSTQLHLRYSVYVTLSLLIKGVMGI